MSSDIEQRAPDYVEPIAGVRAWFVDEDGYLTSTTGRTERWMPGEEKRATCNRVEPPARHVSARYTDRPGLRHEAIRHEAPRKGCSCGLYAFYDRPNYERHGDGFSLRESRVMGVVSAWGEKVILCEYGFKAQYMKLEALVLAQETVNVLGFPVSVKEAHEKLARRYGVPLLSRFQIDVFSNNGRLTVKHESAHKPVALIEAILEWREKEGK